MVACSEVLRHLSAYAGNGWDEHQRTKRMGWWGFVVSRARPFELTWNDVPERRWHILRRISQPGPVWKTSTHRMNRVARDYVSRSDFLIGPALFRTYVGWRPWRESRSPPWSRTLRHKSQPGLDWKTSTYRMNGFGLCLQDNWCNSRGMTSLKGVAQPVMVAYSEAQIL